MAVLTPRFKILAFCGTLLLSQSILATDPSIPSSQPGNLMDQLPQASRKDAYRQRKADTKQTYQQKREALRAQRESGELSKDDHKAAKKAEKKSFKETRKADKQRYKQEKKDQKRAAKGNVAQNDGDNFANR